MVLDLKQSRRMPLRPLPALAAAALLTALATAAGAAPPAEEPEQFGETLDVVVVQVEVVVTDRQGRRVGGLGRADFRLLVEGRETEIEYFSEVREGREVAHSAPVAEAEASSAATQGDRPGRPVVTHHLIFVDDYFAILSHRNRALRAIREQLDALAPEDQVAVMAFDGRELDLLTPWTASRREISGALRAAARRPAHGLMRAHERSARGDFGPWSDRFVQQEELARVFSSVRATLQMLPRPEGRKTLLLLGGGWPVRTVLPDDIGLLSSSLPTLGRGEGEARMDDLALVKDLAGAANLLGYTLYPIDTQGLRVRRDRSSAGAAPRVPGGASQATGGGHSDELFRQGTLRSLADATGGRVLLAADRGRALEAVVEDTRSYYSLGFSPRLAGDGASHRIRVEVAPPGLRVRSRTAYKDLSRAAELDLQAESALRFRGAEEAGDGSAAASDFPVTVSLGESRRTRRGIMEVPLQLELPWSAITLLPAEGEGLAGQLEIRIAARDRHGSLSNVARHYIRLALDEPPGEASVLRWEASLTLRSERHELVVTLYDTLSGSLSTQRVTAAP